MTREEAEQALARCSNDERRIILELLPTEVVLLLEAKLFADATIHDENSWKHRRV
jgi:hypothetical protein